EILEVYEYEVYLETSGNRALDFFRKEVAQVNLVLSDINMPDGDGVEFLKKLRVLLNENIPCFIFMTGFSDFTEEDAKLFGAQKLLKKPVGVSEIIECLEKA